MQSWSKLKLVKVGVLTLLKITLLANRKLCLAIIDPKSNEKLTKYEIIVWSNLVSSRGFHLPLLAIKIPFLSIFTIAYLYLPRTTYMLPYLDLINLIWSYLPLIALILPYVPYSPKYETIVYGDIALRRIWGCRKCWHECSLCVYLVIDNWGGGGYRASFGCENCRSRVLGVSNFKSNLAQGVSTLK